SLRGRGERFATRCCFQACLLENTAAPLATYMRIFKKGEIVDIKGMGTVQKGLPHKCYHGKIGRALRVTQHAVGIIVNKQVKGKFLAKRINVRPEHIKRSESQDFLKRGKENDENKKEAEGKVTWAPQKHQPALPRDPHVGRTGRRSLSRWNLLPKNSWF
uniref:60S ribosomal protein L21 n=1 Tax=Mustela putorius furo TaxID=9669 RepID=M3YU54_MUSPF